MSQKIKVLIPVCEVPEDSCVYKSTKGKVPYIVKRLYTNDKYINILLSDTSSKTISSILEGSTEVILETDLETLNNIYGDR